MQKTGKVQIKLERVNYDLKQNEIEEEMRRCLKMNRQILEIRATVFNLKAFLWFLLVIVLLLILLN